MAVRNFVSTDDHVSISNFMGVYMWLVDTGDEENWGAMFTEDASFYGVPGGDRHGRDEVKKIAGMAGMLGGRYRHLSGSVFIEYGDTKDIAYYNYYGFMSIWMTGQAPVMDNFAHARAILVRSGDSWLIKENRINNLKD